MKMQSTKKAGGNIFGKTPGSAKKRNIVIAAAAVLTVIILVILFLLLSGSETAYRSISIAEISGRVMTENNGNSYAAYENMVIGGGYALTTEKESYTRMLLDGDKYMKLEEQSHAVFENLGDPQSHRTVIRLNYGTFTTEITKPLGNREDYVVNTPNAVLAVRGTLFRVEVSFDANGDAYTDVYTYGGAVTCHRVMPDGAEVDEEVLIGTGYKARIKMDEIITVYVEELIEQEVDHVDPLEMSDVADGQLVDVYNASAHGHEMFRSTGELWDEIVERKIDLGDYTSVYDGGRIPPYEEEEEPEPEETFVTTPAPETTETTEGTLPPDNTETQQQPESSLLSETTGAEPIIAEASALPAETTAAEAFAELSPETTSAAAPTGNVAAETAVTDPIGTSGAAPTGSPVVTTAPTETTVTTPVRTTVPAEDTEESEDTEEPEDFEEFDDPEETAETTATTTAWVNPSPSAEIVTRPQPFTTSVKPAPIVTPTVTGPSHVHTLIEETVAAGCTSDGAVRTKCSVCGTVVSQTVLPALGHNTGSVTVAATCAEDGERLDVCKLCGVIVSRTVIPATGHIADVTTVSPTCEKDGERTEKCRICGTVLSAAILPAAGHTRITETAEATCTESGSITVKCSVCGKILSEETIPAAGHTETTETVEATCAASGLRTVKCSVCGRILRMESIPATAHTVDVTTTAATCEENGERTEVCRICGTVLSTQVIPAAGHTETTETVEADCTENGSVIVTCSVCGKVLREETIPAVGHRYEAAETKPASCTEEGEEAEICTVCGQVKPDSAAAIPKLPHTEVTESDGSVETVKCAVCGEVISRTDLSEPQTIKMDSGIDSSPLYVGESRSYGFTATNSTKEDIAVMVSGDPDILQISEPVGSVLDNHFVGTLTITAKAEGDTWVTLLLREDVSLGVSFPVTVIAAELKIDEENFPDATLRNYILDNFDTDESGSLSETELARITEIAVSGEVSSLAGIELLPALESVRAAVHIENGAITAGDVCGIDPSRISGVSGGNYDESTGIISEIAEGAEVTLIYTPEGGKSVTVTLIPDETSTFWTETPEGVAINEENFPSQKFRNYVSENFDTDGDGTLSEEERRVVDEINVVGTSSTDGGVTSLKGIEYFSELIYLFCEYNSGLTELDVSQNMALEQLLCYDTKITKLDVSKNTVLETLGCSSTSITSLDISKNTALKYLDCGWNSLTSLDVSKNTALLWLECVSTSITSLDVSGCTALTRLNCSGTQIAELDVSNNAALEILYCFGTQIAELDVSNNAALEILYCFGTQIAELDISSNRALQQLYCYNSQLAYIDISNNPSLSDFRAYDNKHPITVTNGSFDTHTIDGFDSTRVSNVQGAEWDEATGVFSGITEGTTEITYTYDCDGAGGHNVTFTLVPDENSTFAPETPEGVAINAENFPDEVFRNYVSTYFDTDTDGYLSEAEITAVKKIGLFLPSPISLKGIEYFTELTELECPQRLTELDVSQNTALKILHCDNAQITALDVSKNTALESLYCQASRLAYVDISNNPFLSHFYAPYNKHPITVTDGSFDTRTIDGFDPTRVSDVQGAEWDETTGVFSGITEGTTEITYTYDCDGAGGHNVTFTLVPDENSTFAPEGVAINEENFPDEVFRNYVSENFDSDMNGYLSETEIEAVTQIILDSSSTTRRITSLVGIENFTKLEELECSGIQITSLDVRNNIALRILGCQYTQITSLDVSNNTALTSLTCYNTQITSLDVSKNVALNTLYFHNTQITSLDISNNTELRHLHCENTQLAFVDISNCSSFGTFVATGCTYPIPSTALSFDITTDLNFAGFNPNRVSNVVGANFSPESGIFDNFTSDTITYTYDCDGAGGHNVTFTLVRSDEAAVSLSDGNDEPGGYLASDLPASGGGALPPGGAEAFSLLPPIGFLAVAQNRKRKTGFRFTQKA